tara:strand:+ start:56297 stop:56452 length:156 start_codon:yes stop_codon:yes gene_type:complete
MSINELNVIGNSIEWISVVTGVEIKEIVGALQGVCFSEEDAGEILEWLRES